MIIAVFKIKTMEEYMIPCLSKKLFGLPCPGCGGQRALLFLFKGDFSDAFWMYPAIYPLIILGFLVILNYFRPFKAYSKSVSIVSIICLGFILINYGYELSHTFGLV